MIVPRACPDELKGEGKLYKPDQNTVVPECARDTIVVLKGIQRMGLKDGVKRTYRGQTPCQRPGCAKSGSSSMERQRGRTSLGRKKRGSKT